MDKFPTNPPIIEQFWQSPPEPINQILDAPPPPTILLSPNREWMVELEKPLLLPIALLAEVEVALAGLFINPKTNAPARHTPFGSMRISAIAQSAHEEEAIASPEISKTVALPDNAQIGFLRWSPNSQKLAFTLTQATGLETVGCGCC
jgi:hypothetical protein